MTLRAACRALVLDDHPLQCLALRDLLQQAGVGHVDTAESAAAALECLRDARYDLVLTDIRMPVSYTHLTTGARTVPGSARSAGRRRTW